MKIGLISSAVPLIQGGGRFIVDWLQQKLRERGHAVEVIYLPSTDEPTSVLQQMAAFRMVRLSDQFDRVVTFRPPAHVVCHPCKVVWFIHHIRVFYDLWDSEYRPVPDLAPWRALRGAIMRADTMALAEAHRVFTNSRTVADRVRRFNGIESEVLYPPLLDPAQFRSGAYGDEIVCISRVEPHKRQHLLLQAMQHVQTAVRLRLCGMSANPAYLGMLQEQIAALQLADRVVLDARWISEAEKASLLATALAAAYVPLDEDSYGYPTLEAAQAKRCTVTLADSGGTMEFVSDGANGLAVEPEPVAIAEAFDSLHADRSRAARLGEAAHDRLAELGIDWENVIAKLLG